MNVNIGRPLNRARNKGSRRAPVNVTVTAPVQGGLSQPTARTLRNRCRRQRQRQARLGLAQTLVNSPTNYFSRYHASADPTMDLSVHKLIQSYFYPQQGVHRSISDGIEPTALTLYQGSFEIASTASNNVITFSAVPSMFGVPATAGAYNFFQWVSGSTFTSPYSASAVPFSGPFAATNPSTAGRIVSFTLNIIPNS